MRKPLSGALGVSGPVQRALLAAGVVLAAAIVAGAVLLARGGHGSPVETRSVTVGVTSPRRPPRGAIVLAAESGTRAVALAVDRRRLTATVLAPTGEPLAGLRLSFRVGGRTLPGRACDAGCYSATVPPGVKVRRVEVLPEGSPAVSFALPATTRTATAIVTRAERVFRSLRSLVYVESLRSGPSGGIVTTWRMVAPDRVSYRIRGGASAVVIGRRRWDRDRPSAPWRRSQQLPPLRVPQPAWGDLATNAHLLGEARVDGRAVWVVSFANPRVPAWFTAWIDRASYRTLRLRMTAAAHFMRHRYLEFDRPLQIQPPR
jgi:hypothetical protein